MNVIDAIPHRLREKFLFAALAPIQALLPAAVIEGFCREAGYAWRERKWGPAVTVLACFWKQLCATASCRQVEDWVAGLTQQAPENARDGHEFCAARQRLPAEIFGRCMMYLGAFASALGAWSFRGLRVEFLDGSTLRTPRTPANVNALGRSRNKYKKSALPLLRILLRVCAGTGAVLELALGPYAASEMFLFRTVLEKLKSGTLLIVDSGFSSFMVLWLASQGGNHILAQQHHMRRGQRLKRLGPGDTLEVWKRPKRPRTTWADLLPLTAATLTVRVIERSVCRPGYKPYALKLCTTLLDPQLYPADELVLLYLQRWDIEVHLRTLKADYHLQRLTGQTPEIVEKEVYAAVGAYNAVQALMTASDSGTPRLSHTRARELVITYAERMSVAPTVRCPALMKELLAFIRSTERVTQNRPPQPRLIVQRTQVYGVLNSSRAKWLRDYYAA